MKLIYRKKTGRVVMVSELAIENEKLSGLDHELTKEEELGLNAGEPLHIKEGVLIFEETGKEKKEKEIDKADNVQDLKNILKKYLT